MLILHHVLAMLSLALEQSLQSTDVDPSVKEVIDTSLGYEVQDMGWLFLVAFFFLNTHCHVCNPQGNPQGNPLGSRQEIVGFKIAKPAWHDRCSSDKGLVHVSRPVWCLCSGSHCPRIKCIFSRCIHQGTAKFGAPPPPKKNKERLPHHPNVLLLPIRFNQAIKGGIDI